MFEVGSDKVTYQGLHGAQQKSEKRHHQAHRQADTGTDDECSPAVIEIEAGKFKGDFVFYVHCWIPRHLFL